MLIRDTAYEGLPKQDRADLHERFAGWVERVASDRADEYAEIVGYHLGQAVRYRHELGIVDQQTAALAERAGWCLQGAGTRAYQRGDDQTAIKLLDRSIDLLPPSKQRRQAMVTLGLCNRDVPGSEEWLSLASRLAEDARAAGDELDGLKGALIEMRVREWSDPEYVGSARADEVRAMRNQFERAEDAQGIAMADDSLSVINLALTHWKESGEAATRGIPFALLAGDDRLAGGLRFLALNAAVWGPAPVSEILPMADELIDSVSSQVPRANMLHLRGLAHAMNGDSAAAHRDVADSMAIRRELGDPELAWAFCAAPIEMVLGDLRAAEREATHNITVLERMGETGQRSTMLGFRARALFDLGRPDDAVLADAEACRRLAQTDDAVSQLMWRAASALVAARAGRIEEAKRWIEDGAPYIEGSGSDFVYEQALTAQDRGYIHTQAGELDDARRWYERALALFEAKGDVMDAARMHDTLRSLPSR